MGGPERRRDGRRSRRRTFPTHGCPAFLAHLRRELTVFSACLNGDLSAPVEHCGDWTLHDLAEHLGRGNLWAAAAVTEQHSHYEAPPAPRDRAPALSILDGPLVA
ncbi:maleylpyruvate isomerase N-terminal domain-containing protein [Actinoallomurus oryzae]|uniref:maleylpyruvate isomerase N-terminal domain-containing protein n=1 Tax=Actinoallomurus oryzae TaxID=502180 RepID=UPI0031EE842D